MSAKVGFKLVRCIGGVTEAAMIEVVGSGTILTGDLVQKEPQGQGYTATRASSTTGVADVIGVAQTDLASGTGVINIIPCMPGQLWEATCTNATATGQIFMRNALSSASSVNNSTTDVLGTTGVIQIWKQIGATSDNKALVEIIRGHYDYKL